MMATMTSSSIEGVLAHKKCIALPIISPYSIYSLDEWMAVEKEKEKRKDRYILRVANRSLSPLRAGIIQSKDRKRYVCTCFHSVRFLFYLVFHFFSGFYFHSIPTNSGYLIFIMPKYIISCWGYTKMRWINFGGLVWGFEKEPNIFYSFELVWRDRKSFIRSFVHSTTLGSICSLASSSLSPPPPSSSSL